MPFKNFARYVPATTEAQEFRDNLVARVRGGSHLILYGPRGAGKSTLLGEMAELFKLMQIPCGLAVRTSSLSDVVSALANAYPGAAVAGLSKRGARSCLRSIADTAPGVLLLDHVTMVNTTMLGYLRRLRGGIVGTLLVVDIDSEREREQLRGWQVGALSNRMPLMSNHHLRQLLAAASGAGETPQMDAPMSRHIVRCARGRVGFVAECARRLCLQDYWQAGRLRVEALCMDTEIALRQSRPGPRVLRRRGAD